MNAKRQTERTGDCAPRTPDRGGLEAFARLFADCGGEGVHCEAVGAKEVCGGRVAAHGKCRDIGCCIGEARENEQSISGKFARVFRRRVIARRQRAGQHLNEAGTWCCFKALEQFGFAWRDKATHDDCAAAGFLNEFSDSRFMFGERLFERQACVNEKRRAKQGEVAHCRPSVRGVKNRVAYVGKAQKAVGVAILPECTRGVELDVAPNGFELARIERQFDISAVVEAKVGGGWVSRVGREVGTDGGRVSRASRTDGGLRPPNPLQRSRLAQAGKTLAGQSLNLGGGCALLREGFGKESSRILGFGGGASVPSAVGFFNRFHQCEIDPERVEVGREVVANNHEKVNMIGHDDEVRDCYGWVDGMKRQQKRFDGFSRWQQRGASLSLNEAREQLRSPFKRERNKEELKTRMAKLKFHMPLLYKSSSEVATLTGFGAAFLKVLTNEDLSKESK